MLADSDLLPLGRGVAQWVRGRRYGEIRVVDASCDVISDVDGYTALEFTVVVSDPRDDTWPIDDVLALGDAVRTEARERDLSLMVYVNLRPETDEPQEDDEMPGR